MFKAIFDALKEVFDSLISCYPDLWNGEDTKDIPTALKVIGVAFMVLLDIVFVGLSIIFIPLMFIVGLAISLIWKGSFNEQTSEN